MPLSQITDPETHDTAIAEAHPFRDDPTLVVIYVSSSSIPRCITTTPKVEALAEKYNGSGKNIKFYQMELDKNTQPMIKFSVQNTPIFIAMKAKWCTTILGGDLRTLEREIEQRV